MSAQLFDRTKHFRVPVLSTERKECVLRFPTDEEFCERAAKSKAIRRFLGRGKSQIEVLNHREAAAALFDKIRVDKEGGPTFTAAEAAKAISKIDRCDILSSEREGNTFRIEMQVPGALVLHVFKSPSAEAQAEYADANSKTMDSARFQEFKLRLEPSAALWKECSVETVGYADPGAVPINHKDTAISELVRMIDAAEEEAEIDPER
jgi:hypothetical protein